MHEKCLNCSQPVSTKFCSNCGQKFSTHRYSLKHFIEHDFIHGVWHVDKGILFTIKELFTRPGNSVREYILGKRANYFNFVTLLLLTITISAILSHYSTLEFKSLATKESQDMMGSIEKLFTTYPKIVLLVSIPINSIFSYLWFRKAAFNYSEHLVLNSYKTAAEMIAGLALTFFTLFFASSPTLASSYLLAFTLFSISYGTWFYFQFFSQSGYSKISLMIRSLMIPASFMLFQFVIGFLWGTIILFFK
ncbi:DUF3667 domain-containing protein [Chryseobacterium sp. M5A1_1a]